MKTILFLFFIVMFTFSNAQQSDDKLRMRHNLKIDSIIQTNDSLKLIYYHVLKSVKKEKIDSILMNYDNGIYDVKKTQLSLMLTQIFGEDWNFEKDSQYTKNFPKLKTFEDLKKFKDIFPKFKSMKYQKDGKTIKEVITAMQNGEVIIFESLDNGRYLKKHMDKMGNITIEEVDEIEKP